MSSNRTVLATAFFDGQPTRKPMQSFSSHSETKDDFLRHLHEERQKRELERRRNEAAVKIQAFWRRHKCRYEMRKQLRRSFDEIMKTDVPGLQLQQAIRQLLVFFSPEIDGERLLSIGQKMVKSYGSGDRHPITLILLLLIRCLRYLKYAAPKDQNVSIAMPFRCLEVYALDDRNDSDDQRWSRLVLINGLVKHGYYDVLRDLFDYRCPNDLMHEQVKAPTFQAESYMKALVQPLAMLRMANVFPMKDREQILSEITSSIWRSLIANIFAKSPMSPIVRFYVLPHFAALKEADVLGDLAKYAADSGDPRFRTPEFAYSLAYLLTKRQADLDGRHFIAVYANVSESLLNLVRQQTRQRSVSIRGEEANEEANEPMEVDVDHSSGHWLVSGWLSMNHSEDVVSYLARLADVSSGSHGDASMVSLINLCRLHWIAENFDGSRCRFLKTVAYKPRLLGKLWQSVITASAPSVVGPPHPLIEDLQKGCSLNPEDRRRLIPLLSVFCALFSTTLAAANDEEFYHDWNLKASSSTIPFSRSTLASLSTVLRDITLGLIQLALPDSRPSISEQYREALTTMGVDFSEDDTREWNQLFDDVVRLLQLLHDRDERLQFCPIGSWSVGNHITFQHLRQLRRSNANSQRSRRLFHVLTHRTRQQLEQEGTVRSSAELRNLVIMRRIPFVVPFEQRVEFLYQLVRNDQEEHGRVASWQNGVAVNVRRNFLYEDAYDQLSLENVRDLRQVVRVRLQNWAGAVEAGVDGGGLFREFLNELLKTAFDPQRGFFIATAHDSTLYPNPLAPKLFPDGAYRRHYFFLGRMVGKLIYENQLAELRFSRFFLSELLGTDNEVDVHHLSYYDPLLYRNLIRLKNDDDIEMLGLDFSVLSEELGEIKRYELKPDGCNIPVTSSNRLEYIQLLAEFYLRRQIKLQTDAFRDGLADLIDLDWLQMFDYRELQVLVSGADRDIDVDDLRRNAIYSGDIKEGGESGDDYVASFWSIVRGFSEDQKRKLLKFVTSCSRPPLLGFQDLHPPFAVQIYNLRDNEPNRLPTAMTCCNLLKLPRFQDAAMLKEKLLYAVESGAGFELS